MTGSAQDGARADLCRAAQRRCQATHQGQPEAAQASRLTLSPSDRGVHESVVSRRLDRFVVQLFRYCLAMSDRTEHCHEDCVEAVGPFDALSRQDLRERSGVSRIARSCQPPSPPWAPTRRFECRDVKCVAPSMRLLR